MFKFIGWVLSIGFILIALWLFMIFGPIFHIDYENCVDVGEKNIISNARVYERVFNTTQDKRQYSRYRYDAPLLCVDAYRNNMCKNSVYSGAGYQLKKIDARKVLLTGRIIKMYSFNAFNDDMYRLEVSINNKKYFVSHYEYDDMVLDNNISNFQSGFREPRCSIFSLF